MADEETNEAAAEGGEGKKGLPLAPIIVVAAVMVVEAIVLAAVFMFMGGPSEVQADTALPDELIALEEPADVLLIHTRFQNTSTGENFLYETEIYGRIKAKHAEKVEELVQAKIGSIKAECTRIFRKASFAHLNENDLATLKRQVKSALVPMFGDNPDGEPYLDDVIIAKVTRMAGDY